MLAAVAQLAWQAYPGPRRVRGDQCGLVAASRIASAARIAAAVMAWARNWRQVSQIIA